MAATYSEAGVDMNGIIKSQDRIGEIISGTHKDSSVAHGFGHYAGVVEVGDGTLLAMHTDGVGTKVMVANALKRYDTIGIDCVAMNVNDIVCVGATPVSFVDYIAASRNDECIFTEIARGLAAGAREGMVPIVGGETAIMPDLFGGDGFSFDLAGTIAGTIQRDSLLLGEKTDTGDAIIGAYSSGIHSNGYTLARRVLQKYPLDEKVRGLGRIGDALLTPTEIYARPVLEILDGCDVHGLAHITGGAFTKLLRLKKTGFCLDMLPEPPPIFQLIQDNGVAKDEMYRTFNMGIGFCVVSPEEYENEIMMIFKKHGVMAERIGSIIRQEGVFVGSKKIA